MSAANVRRFDLNGYPLHEVIHVTTCGECGMGLVSGAEFHPFRACEVYKETHNSSAVWDVLLPTVEDIQRDREEARWGGNP